MGLRLQRIDVIFVCFILMLTTAFIGFKNAPAVFATEADSQTDALYGYVGEYDESSAMEASLNISLGNQVLDDLQLINHDNPAVQVLGSSDLIVRDSYIRTQSTPQTAPSGDSLFIAGSAPATLNQESSQSYYINSTVESTDLGVLCSVKALPALQENSKELAVYLFGSKAVANDGGCGAYLDLFCNFFAFGSNIQSAEIGIISDTYGSVVLGNISDGENNAELGAVLTDENNNRYSDKELDTLIEGGRNALVVQSTSRELSQEYKDYLKEELQLLSASIQAHDTILKTDLTLDKNVEYPEQAQAYIDHTKGSVILVKSTNAEITLDACELLADENGTGYLIQTVISNDTSSGFAVPESESYPGISAVIKDMKVSGNIAHEDYQRDFSLDLVSSEFTGAMNQFGFAAWQDAAQKEGFEDYCTDKAYDTHHGLYVSLAKGSVWNVTADSYLTGLEFEPDCTVNGIIYLNGVEQSGKEMSYTGDVVVKPLPGTPATTPEPSETHEHNFEIIEWVDQTCTTDGHITYQCTECTESYTDIYPATGHDFVAVDYLAPGCETDGYVYYECSYCGEGYADPIPATGHNWIREGGSPADCTHPGFKGWVCTNCGDTYLEYISDPLGHDWYLKVTVPPTCEVEGHDIYECARCSETYSDYNVPKIEHNFLYSYMKAPTCSSYGYDLYTCSMCGELLYLNYRAPVGTDKGYGHTYVLSGEYDTVYHYYVCVECGTIKAEIHYGNPCAECGYDGPKG